VITKILALKNIGAFENWEWPQGIDAGLLPTLGRVTVIAGENGKGKTTIAAVLRSVQDDDAKPVLERRRACAEGGYENFLAKIEHDNGKATLISDSRWNGPRPTLFVFDDTFVSRNVYEGLSVGAEQREALHELIIGEAGVQEAKKVEMLATEVSELKKQQKLREAKLTKSLRHLTLDRMLRESPPADIDTKLTDVARNLKSAAQVAAIQALPDFIKIPQLPNVPVDAVQSLLATPIEQIEEAAQKRVLDHLESVGNGSVAWIQAGLDLVGKPQQSGCPFCAQELGESATSLIAAYRAHFSNEYESLQQRCAQTANQIGSQIPESLPATLLTARQRLSETQRQWLVHLPNLPALVELPDLDALVAVRIGLLHAIEAKRSAPLVVLAMDEVTTDAIGRWKQIADELNRINSIVDDLRRQAHAFKNASSRLDESSLRRHQAELDDWKVSQHADVQKDLSDYKAAKVTMDIKVQDLERAKNALLEYQNEQFPKFRDAINDRLKAYGATFSLVEVSKTKGTKGGDRRVDYVLKAASTSVKVSSTPAAGAPHFGSLLSAGDRRTLAFAFFVTMLEGKTLDGATIVCDDPTTSLDLDRRSRTVTELLALAKRGAQLVILSHFEPLLLDLEDRVSRLSAADQSAQINFSCLRIVGGNHQSRLSAHQLDRRTPLAKHRDAIQSFVAGESTDRQGIPNQCRKLLEGIVQTCFPDCYLPGGCLKDFCERVQPLLDAGRLHKTTFDEIRELRDFFNPESHFQPGVEPTENEIRANAARLLRLAKLRLGTGAA
jgi:wobble nucleotide-excising tRNase